MSMTDILKNLSILHVCGGDPNRPTWVMTILEYSPRMWR